MKHFSLLRFALAGLLLTALAGCLRDECTSTRTFIRFDPVYKLPAEFRVGITAEAPRTLKNPGKMLALDNFLFINERLEGIHVIDNSDPTHPQNIAFWKIPGNVDMAIKDHHLYADQYVDLLTIDISDFQHPQLECTQQDAFQLQGFVPGSGYIVDYTQTEVTEQINCNDVNWGNVWFRRGGVVFAEGDAVSLISSSSSFSSFAGPATPNFSNANSGAVLSGSYARFGIVDDYLYTVDNAMLRSWSIQNPSCPARTDSMYAGWNIETIFPFKDRLFLGSQSGVFIYNNSNQAHPVLESSFVHATGCDPVVCDDNNAYVTLHSGTTCNGTINQLDVVDIKNLPNTTLTRTYPMTEPKGLSITNDHLFLCDDGLKVYDKKYPDDLKLLAHVKGIITYDVIALSDNHLVVTGPGGFYQYDVTDPANPQEISLVPVVK